MPNELKYALIVEDTQGPMRIIRESGRSTAERIVQGAGLASLAGGLYFVNRLVYRFQPTYFLFSLAFILASIGVGLYFVSRRLLKEPSYFAVPVWAYDVAFTGFMCLALVELHSSVFYRSLGFFVSVTAAFMVLLGRAVISRADILQKRRAVNVVEGYVLIIFLFISPLYLNFTPRFWDSFYHFINTQGVASTGFINVVQTYQGFPAFYVFNAMLINAGIGSSYTFGYLLVDSVLESAGVLAVYLAGRGIGGEKAGLIAMLAAGATTFYTDFQLVPAWVSLALFFYGVYFLVARQNERGGFLAFLLVATGLLLYHPIGALALAALLATIVGTYLISHRRIERQTLLIMYLAISLTYLVFVAQSAFSALVQTYSSTPPGVTVSSTLSFQPYFFVFYAPLVTPILFGGFYISKVVIERLPRVHFVVAVLPIVAASAGLVQILAGIQLTESIVSSLLPLLLLIPVGLAISTLSASRLLSLLCVGIIGIVFLAAITSADGVPYFGRADFQSAGSSPYGTNQQIEAVTFFEKVPASANLSSDIVTGSWGNTKWSLEGVPGLHPWAAIDSANYVTGSYLIFSATPTPGAAYQGNPGIVVSKLQNLTYNGDVVYSSGSVTALIVRN